MIADWTPLPVLQQKWPHDPSLFIRAVTVLDTALSQQEVSNTLAPPTFDLTSNARHTTAFDVAAVQTAMLTYTLTELSLSAIVEILP